MSADSTIAKLAKQDALLKLGMVSGAGPIAYKSRPTQHNPSFDYTADKREQLWSEFDQEGRVTGEESALGMPSPGMKHGSWSGSDSSEPVLERLRIEQEIGSDPSYRLRAAGLYGLAGMGAGTLLPYGGMQTAPVRGGMLGALTGLLMGGVHHSNALKDALNRDEDPSTKHGSWSGGYGDNGGAVAQGSFDGNKQSPHKDQVISSAVQESFKTLEDYDQGYAPESPMTQPHGSKHASNAFAGSSMMGTNDLIPKAPKPPSTPSQGQSQKAQGEEEAGMNLVKQVQEYSREKDVNNSFASPQKRLMGSPL